MKLYSRGQEFEIAQEDEDNVIYMAQQLYIDSIIAKGIRIIKMDLET